MFDIDYLTDSMNYIPVSLDNQANPHAGTSENTNNAGTSQTPKSNASEEKDEDVELIVVPSAVQIPEEIVDSRTSSTKSKNEKIFDKKGYQSQKEQKQAKTDKKRKRQVQERDLKPISKARHKRKDKKVKKRMTKVIKGEFEKIKDVKVEDVSLTCDTSLKYDDSEHEVDDDMGYDPSDIRGDYEVLLTDEESFDDKDKVAEVFRIDTNLFNFETLMCETFTEFNYLLQIDPDLLTKDIEGFKTYDDYKDD
ncbi:hypothetical protein Tco_1515615 [Tanacetum coccineum]